MDPVNRPCSEETESKLRNAMGLIHTILADAMGKNAPSRDGYALMGQQTAHVLTVCDKINRESVLAGLRAAVVAIVAPAILAKRAEGEAFEASMATVTEAFRAIIRKASPTFDHVAIPLASFAPLFPVGTDVGRMAAALRELAYKVVGNSDNMTVRAAV